MTDEQLVPYLAGFFDGEGTISLVFNKKGYFHNLVVAVSQNESGVLELFKARFGGSIYAQKWHKADRAFYSCQATSNPTKTQVLQTLSAYLVVKKREAEIGLAFLETNVKSKWKFTGESKIEWFVKRESMRAEMKRIKKARTIIGMRQDKQAREGVLVTN